MKIEAISKWVSKAKLINEFERYALLISMCGDDLLFEAPAKPVRRRASSNRQLEIAKILEKFYEALTFAPLFVKKKWKRGFMILS